MIYIKIGKNAYKNGSNDYHNSIGVLYFCNKCCNDWRIQFLNVGNDELLTNFDLTKCVVSFNRQLII